MKKLLALLLVIGLMFCIGCAKETYSAKAQFANDKIVVTLTGKDNGDYSNNSLWTLFVKDGVEIIEICKPTIDNDENALWQYIGGDTATYVMEFAPIKTGTEYWLIKGTMDENIKLEVKKK